MGLPRLRGRTPHPSSKFIPSRDGWERMLWTKQLEDGEVRRPCPFHVPGNGNKQKKGEPFGLPTWHNRIGLGLLCVIATLG